MKLDLILIDAFFKDCYKYCPFLSQLRKNNFSSDLTPIIGYQQHLASLFSGSLPQEINIWNTFKFSPQTSIFWWTHPFSSFKLFDYKFIKYFIDFISYFFAGIGDMLAVRIPIKTMSNFDIILRRPITVKNSLASSTIFDLLRERKISFSYFKGGLKYTDKSNNFLFNLRHLISRFDRLTIKTAFNDQSDFKFIYLMELDHLSHRFGLDSVQVKKHLKEIDQLLENYLNKSNRPFIIISDHGLVEVRGTIDIMPEINSLGLVLGKDYLVFLESVIARFWFFNEEAEKKIVIKLKEIRAGHILSQEEKQEFGLNFKNNQLGDLFFILELGRVIIPNYFQTKKGVKAMHGYAPQFNQGVFLTNLEINKQVQTINFIDVIPTIADFFNLPKIGSGGSLLNRT